MTAAISAVSAAAVPDAGGTSGAYRVARTEGMAPALRALIVATAPGLLPAGPGGHCIVPSDVRRHARGVWAGGRVTDRVPTRERTVLRADLTGGEVELLTGVGPPDRARRRDRTAWVTGLAWLRLGLSEALRAVCVAYLGGRRSGDTYLLAQQMVKGTLAEAAVDQVEVRAVLEDVDHHGPGHGPTAVELADLHERLTCADRRQVRLLGASGMLAGGPGETAYVSELLAEVYVEQGTGPW